MYIVSLSILIILVRAGPSEQGESHQWIEDNEFGK